MPPRGISQQPMDADFDVGVDSRAGATVVVPRGELDLATVPVLTATLAAQAGPVVLDLRELTFVDPTGLRLLLEAEVRPRQTGGIRASSPLPWSHACSRSSTSRIH